MMESAFGGLTSLFYISLLVFTLWMQARLLQKAGYAGWWTLVTLIPLFNLVMMYVFAFHKWPVERQMPAPGTEGTGPAPDQS